jgi:hypothetical protein
LSKLFHIPEYSKGLYAADLLSLYLLFERNNRNKNKSWPIFSQRGKRLDVISYIIIVLGALSYVAVIGGNVAYY